MPASQVEPGQLGGVAVAVAVTMLVTVWKEKVNVSFLNLEEKNGGRIEVIDDLQV
jgi:hypothetical protein